MSSSRSRGVKRILYPDRILQEDMDLWEEDDSEFDRATPPHRAGGRNARRSQYSPVVGIDEPVERWVRLKPPAPVRDSDDDSLEESGTLVARCDVLAAALEQLQLEEQKLPTLHELLTVYDFENGPICVQTHLPSRKRSQLKRDMRVILACWTKVGIYSTTAAEPAPSTTINFRFQNVGREVIQEFAEQIRQENEKHNRLIVDHIAILSDRRTP